MEDILDLNSIKKKMLRKYPAFGSTINSVKYQIVGINHPVTTAATDGKTIYVNAEFLNKLPEQEQIFIFAHEVCHIALNHIMRSKGKDPRVWNIATDAIINQHLQNDGLPMIEGGVNIADALAYDAEELYEKLLQKQQEKNQQGQNGQGKGCSGDGEQAIEKNEDQVGHDSHSMWEDAVKKQNKNNLKTAQANLKKMKSPKK